MFQFKPKQKDQEAERVLADLNDLAQMRGFSHIMRKLEARKMELLTNLKAGGRNDTEVIQSSGALLECEFIVALLKECYKKD